MNITRKLEKLSIIPTRKLNFEETNYIAKTVAEKITKNIQELSEAYNEIFMRIFNCNMYYANINKDFGKVVYFYQNNTLYFDESWGKEKNVNEYVIRECLHYLQNFKKFNGEEKKIGACNFTEFKIYGLGLNEAIIHYIATKANGEAPHRLQIGDISLYTINDVYYPYLTSLAIQILFCIKNSETINSIIYGTEEFENDLYNTFEENTNKILNNFDNILKENNKIEKNIKKIENIYLKTQKMIYTTYFEKACAKVETIDEVEKYTKKLYEYEKIEGKKIDEDLQKNELIKFTKTIESKLNQKYINIYESQSKNSLIVICKKGIAAFFERLANFLEKVI